MIAMETSHKHGFALSRSRRVVLFVMLVFLLRALVPAGFMPDTGRKDGFSMVICTADGPQIIQTGEMFQPDALDHDGSSGKHEGPAAHDTDRGGTCLFALNAKVFAPAPVAAFTVVALRGPVLPDLPPLFAPVAARFFGNAAPQAPPVVFFS